MGSSLVSSACVRPRSAAFGSVLPRRSRTWAGLGGLASLALKIGRSAVRLRTWPPLLAATFRHGVSALYSPSTSVMHTAERWPGAPPWRSLYSGNGHQSLDQLGLSDPDRRS